MGRADKEQKMKMKRGIGFSKVEDLLRRDSKKLHSFEEEPPRQIFEKKKKNFQEAFLEFTILNRLKDRGCRVPRCYEIRRQRLFDHSPEEEETVLLWKKEEASIPLLSMEWVGKMDLFSALVESSIGSRVTWKNLSSAIRIAASAAEVLKSVHLEEEIHGDVKLENLMLDSDLQVWMIDFERTGFSVPFIPPEGLQASMPADAWTLGIVIFLIMMSTFEDVIPWLHFRSEGGYKDVMRRIDNFDTDLGDKVKAYEISRIVKGLLQKNEKDRMTVLKAAEALSKLVK